MEQTVADILTCFSGVICAIRRHAFPSSTLKKILCCTYLDGESKTQPKSNP